MAEDARLAYLPERIRQALATDERCFELGVRVVAVGGGIVLTGLVPTAELRRTIEEVCRELSDDLAVVNDIEVSPVAEPDTVEEMG